MTQPLPLKRTSEGNLTTLDGRIVHPEFVGTPDVIEWDGVVNLEDLAANDTLRLHAGAYGADAFLAGYGPQRHVEGYGVMRFVPVSYFKLSPADEQAVKKSA